MLLAGCQHEQIGRGIEISQLGLLNRTVMDKTPVKIWEPQVSDRADMRQPHSRDAVYRLFK